MPTSKSAPGATEVGSVLVAKASGAATATPGVTKATNSIATAIMERNLLLIVFLSIFLLRKYRGKWGGPSLTPPPYLPTSLSHVLDYD